MNETLFIETSSQKIFSSQTKSSTSSWQTLALQRSSAKSHSQPRFVARHHVGQNAHIVYSLLIEVDVAPEILENSNHRRYTRAVDVWSLGVVLYICLCGFPPFSDELYSPENPYTLSQQIKMGRFDYPSPYWDSVGDPALDLIDRMLTVDVDQRITIDECLEHPWTTQDRPINVNDSTDGLTGAISKLDFSKRKIQRERTLLSDINEIKVSRVIQGNGDDSVKVYEKNNNQKATAHQPKERQPDDARHPKEFIEMGGKGDQTLYSEDDNGSRYVAEQSFAASELKD